MKTKEFFAVEVFDNTCNDFAHQSGIYGRGDYSWITEPLNSSGEYNMTEEEANEVKADFERVIRERNLEWASVAIDSIEMPVVETMQDVADYYNESDSLNVAELESMIQANGWVSDCDTEWGICHNDTEKVIVNDDGEAVVVPITTKNKWHEMPESAKVANLKEINETYDFSKYDAETAAYNVRMGYENDPDWFHFIVDDLNDFEREVAELLTRFF